MAAADTAKLVASLTLDAKGFQSGVKEAQSSLGGLEGTIGNIGRKAGQGLQSLTRNVALLGVAAAGGIAVAVKGGLSDLAALETSITSVDGAIKQLGLTGQLTGAQVADWANDIERDIGAAFDDKEITAAANTLLRFGKVTPKNLKQALVVMTDLAAKTGDVESAATTLAKALADPAKAAGKLAKQGIVLTKAQQETIKAMVEQNDIAGAQQVILDELAKTTGGAALASQGKYARSIAVLNDVAEDARKALAEGFFPVIEKVSLMLSKGLADPKFVNALREFGTTLAGGLDDLISVATKLPWATIGDSLKLAGTGAKIVLDAFVALPPWVQTAVLTGWGLNKLTGGAFTGIIGELAKGVIVPALKGALGIQAAQVNITAANVTGVGGGTGTGPAGGLAGKLAPAAALASGVVILGVTQTAAADLTTAIAGKAAGQIATSTGSGSPLNITGPLDRLLRALNGDFRSGAEVAANTDKMVGKMDTLGIIANKTDGLLDRQRDQNAKTAQLLDAVHNSASQAIATGAKNQAAAFATRDAVNNKVGPLAAITAGVRTAVDATKAAAAHAGQQTAAAIRDKDLSVTNVNNVSVKTSVSVRETINGQTTYKQFQRFIS